MRFLGLNIGWATKSATLTLDQLIQRLEAVYQTASGSTITPESALQSSTVQAVIRAIGGHIATLPVHVLLKGTSRNRASKEPLPNHPAQRLLNAPNEHQDRVSYWLDATSWLLRYGNFYAFKARYCIMGGFEGRQVLKYINLDELSQKIASCSFRVIKDECMDLPPKIYQKRRVYMSDAQAKAYEQMKRTMLATIRGKEVSATIQLTQVMKLQQITGGYVKMDDGSVAEIVKPENNPLIKETMGLVEEAGDQKVLIWAHFHEEIDALIRVLRKEGYKVAQFDGRVPERERLQIRRDFKNGKYDVLVGNQGAGGMGIDEFKIASVVIYYSNSYDTEARIQSEDRTHRGGSEMHDHITYYDIVVPNTVRVKIIATLRNNKSISDEVMRDGLQEWI